MTPRITPWRDVSEWQFVKACFFPKSDGLDMDPRPRALARVSAWHVRGRVPHAVVSTAMLTTAVLRDQDGSMSILEARMLLSMAITRFVNGLLDPAQQAVFAISMTALARSIGLPESFVEIRHSATHDALPSLSVLREALFRALDWLWRNYWELPPVTTKLHTEQEENAILSEQFGNILKAWKKLRKDDPAKPLKTGDPSPVNKQSLALLKEVSNMRTTSSAANVLARAFLEPRLLLAKHGKSQELWLPILDCSMARFPSFRTELIVICIEFFAQAARSSVEPDGKLDNTLPRKQVTDDLFQRLREWILHFIKQTHPGQLDTKQVTRSLSLASDSYTLHIMTELQTVPGFEGIGRLIKLRTGIRSMDDIKASKVTSGNAAYADTQYGEHHGKHQASPSWQRNSNYQKKPIGFLITA